MELLIGFVTVPVALARQKKPHYIKPLTVALRLLIGPDLKIVA